MLVRVQSCALGGRIPIIPPHGDHGVTVNTGDCGPPNSGSIPDGRPDESRHLIGVETLGESGYYL